MEKIELFRLMGDQDFDYDRYYHSETGQVVLGLESPFSGTGEYSTPENQKYWKSLGLLKEVHNEGDITKHWYSFLPIHAEGQGEKLPLVFVMHGHANILPVTETYGYTHLAAKYGFIVVMSKDEHPEVIDEMYAYALENFPVDTSRVYMVGYSFGGFMTSWHTLHFPRRYAAAGIGGMFAAGYGIDSDDFDDTDNPIWYHIPAATEEELKTAEALKMPVMITVGEREILQHLPIWREEKDEPVIDHPKGAIDLSVENKLRGLNIWRRVNGISPITREELGERIKASADETEKHIGYSFDKTNVEKIIDRNYYIGELRNSAGIPMIRIAGIEEAPHWPTLAQCELTWNFVSQFRRDPETGRLEIIGEGIPANR
ncbi:MAG: prolyl oligopeptidase family serine peptidase [Blautia sp.]|nr:prolyl oligopeptidase family serine peptidase [Blautia sp.]